MIESAWLGLGALVVGPFTEFSFMQRALAGCLALSLSGKQLAIPS